MAYVTRGSFATSRATGLATPPPGQAAAHTDRPVARFFLVLSTGQLQLRGSQPPSFRRRRAVTHVGDVLGKLGLRDPVQAVITAYETALIFPAGN